MYIATTDFNYVDKQILKGDVVEKPTARMLEIGLVQKELDTTDVVEDVKIPEKELLIDSSSDVQVQVQVQESTENESTETEQTEQTEPVKPKRRSSRKSK